MQGDLQEGLLHWVPHSAKGWESWNLPGAPSERLWCWRRRHLLSGIWNCLWDSLSWEWGGTKGYFKKELHGHTSSHVTKVEDDIPQCETITEQVCSPPGSENCRPVPKQVWEKQGYADLFLYPLLYFRCAVSCKWPLPSLLLRLTAGRNPRKSVALRSAPLSKESESVPMKSRL